MADGSSSLLDRIVQARALKRWARAARLAEKLPPGELRELRGQALALSREIGRVVQVAEERLSMPAGGGDGIERPLGCDWAWRPDFWRQPVQPRGIAPAQNRAKFGAELTLFHDCANSALMLRQIRNTRAEDIAPFALRMDVFRFEGSFLSLVLDLPDAAVRGLRRNQLVRLGLDVALERPLEIFCRLNIKHGPNTEQIVREMGPGESFVEFDLGYAKLNEKRLEKAWVDLIFEGPQMNEIVLRDLTMLRHPRAEL